MTDLEDQILKERVQPLLDRGDVTMFQVVMKKASPADLKINRATLRFGQLFFLKSSQDGSMESIARKITKDTDPSDLKMWLENGMIYVPLNWDEYYLRNSDV